MAETFLLLMPPLVIADLGAGEGTVSQLLARRAKKVIAVDNSEKMVEFGSSLARSHGVKNLEYRLGDLEELPVKKGEADVAFFSQSLHHAQHPPRALAEAFRILKPGGRVIILDLLKHHFEEARALYADVWLGFSEVELRRMLSDAGFQNISTALVHREAEAPHFETILAGGRPLLDGLLRRRESRRTVATALCGVARRLSVNCSRLRCQKRQETDSEPSTMTTSTPYTSVGTAPANRTGASTV